MHIDPLAADPVVLARATGPQGEVVLRQRGDVGEAVHELIVNGAFAMDSVDTSSERELARLAFPVGSAHRTLLIGGLGLGYTAAEALHLGAERIDVVEREPALVEWARLGLTPTLSQVAADPRTRLVVGDIADVLLRRRPSAVDPAREPALWDAILLDVDNGPDFLIHSDNAALYTAELLGTAYGRLAPRGRLAIWCQGPAPALLDTLRRISATAHEHHFTVSRGDRSFSYAIYTLDRPPTAPAPAG